MWLWKLFPNVIVLSSCMMQRSNSGEYCPKKLELSCEWGRFATSPCSRINVQYFHGNMVYFNLRKKIEQIIRYICTLYYKVLWLFFLHTVTLNMIILELMVCRYAVTFLPWCSSSTVGCTYNTCRASRFEGPANRGGTIRPEHGPLQIMPSPWHGRTS